MNDRHLKIVALLMGFLTTLLMPPIALAQKDTNKAKECFRHGVALFEKEDYQGALKAFKESYAVFPRTSTLFNVAMCQKALTRYPEAIETFESFLEKRETTDNPIIFQIAQDTLMELGKKIGKLSIESAPDRAQVYLDNSEVARTPLKKPIYVNPGKHTVRVSKTEYTPFEMTVAVKAGAKVILIADLEPSPGEQNPAAPMQAPKLVVETAPPNRDPGLPAITAEKRQKISPLMMSGLITTGLGLIATGVGIYFTAEYYKVYAEGDEARKNHDRHLYDENPSERDKYAEIHEDINQEQIPAAQKGIIAGYVTGGVLLVGGCLMMILDRAGDEKGAPDGFKSLSSGRVSFVF